MSLAAKLRRAPLRIVTGAFLLNAGVGKFSADDDTAKNLHGMASGAYPIFEKVPPKAFAKGKCEFSAGPRSRPRPIM